MIRMERAYHSAIKKGEYRCLVDRLWPRGISKEILHLDAWMKDLGPSTVLRRWFNHDPSKFDEFKEKYLLELQSKPKQELLHQLVEISKTQDVVLLYASKEEVYNQASILLELVQDLANHD